MIPSTKRLFRSTTASLRSFSSTASSPSLVNVTTVPNEPKISVLTLNLPPVNSLSLELLTDLHTSLKSLEECPDTSGVILASSSPSVFCAGLDINEMYNPSFDRLEAFWTTLQDVYKTLYYSPLVTVASISGHAPAGGCLLSLCCDYRFMANNPKFRIGLNETQLGIVAPSWFQSTLKATVGHRTAERMLGLGLQLSPEEALNVGLVDKLVERDEISNAAIAEMKQWLKIPSTARIMTKQQVRKDVLNVLKGHEAADYKVFRDAVASKGAQASMGRYLESLKK